MNVWIGLIGTAVGAIIGGILALLNAHIQLRRQVHRDRQKLLLAKLEELHGVLGLLRQSYKAADLKALSYIQEVELSPKVKDALYVPIERLQMLVGCYAPELSVHLEKIEKCREVYSGRYGDYIMVADREEPAAEVALSAVLSQQTEIQNACDEMQAAVVLLARKYI